MRRRSPTSRAFSTTCSSSITCSVANPAAIALYKSMGFEPFGLERDFLLVDGVLHDELHMTFEIKREGP